MTRRTGILGFLALASVAASMVALAFAISNVSVQPGSGIAAYEPTATSTPAAPVSVRPVASFVTPEPGAEPAPVEPARPVRFTVAAAGVDAPVVELGLDANGNMADPDGPDEVAWYTFTGQPGARGNAVFSGHLDWYATGPAVFWNMRNVVPGDRISVTLSDGTVVEYAVASRRTYALADVPMAQVLEATNTEAVTIITCAGEFINGDYTDRMVIRAFRVSD